MQTLKSSWTNTATRYLGYDADEGQLLLLGCVFLQHVFFPTPIEKIVLEIIDSGVPSASTWNLTLPRRKLNV